MSSSGRARASGGADGSVFLQGEDHQLVHDRCDNRCLVERVPPFNYNAEPVEFPLTLGHKIIGVSRGLIVSGVFVRSFQVPGVQPREHLERFSQLKNLWYIILWGGNLRTRQELRRKRRLYPCRTLAEEGRP
jgi:hypothetical protein